MRKETHQAIGSAIQNGMLVAHELGLGTCWIGEILPHESEVKELLSVPDHLSWCSPDPRLSICSSEREGAVRLLKELLLSWD